MFTGGEIVGFVKFFRDEWKLDKLIEGCFYCNTPEFYRLSGDEGVSDKFESCIFSYRIQRRDEPIKLIIQEKHIADIQALTVQAGADYDSWLHCWMALAVPRNSEGLESLKQDIVKIKKEFGSHYAFLPAENLGKFTTRLKKLTQHKVEYGLIEYSPDASNWNSFCKSISYSYQREFRFAVGKCSPSEIEHIEITNPNGFSKLIYKNCGIEIKDKNNGTSWLNIDEL